MLSIDPDEYVAFHREQLLAEADRERLAALLPAASFDVRRELAVACYRMARWLEEPTRYVQRPETGREHWAAR